MRRTSLIALAIFATVLFTRLPFAAQTLWAHDSVLYANAIEHGFHVDDELLLQRPHPPGYFFYVEAAALAHSAGLPSNAALVLVSAVATALAAMAIFLLAGRWVRERAALLAAAAFAADPLVWQYSDIAYPYAVLALGSIVVAAACLWARGGDTRRAVVASAVFGVAAGFRQDLLLLLFPLWLWATVPFRARRVAAAVATLAATSLLWIVPTIALSGGPLAYLGALATQTTFVRDTYSIFGQGTPAFVTNIAATSWSLGWGLFVFAPLALAATLVVARNAWAARRISDGEFVLLWSLPPLVVYVVLQIGDWGYALSALPGLYVLGARALDRVLAMVPAYSHRASLAGWGVLVALPAALFMWAPLPFSASDIATHDEDLGTRVAYVRTNFPARSTVILTREDFMLVRYYLPEYRSRQYDPDPYVHTSRRMRIRVERVVVFTAGLVPERAIDVRRVACNKKGVELVYLDVVPGTVLEFNGERYAVAPPPS